MMVDRTCNQCGVAFRRQICPSHPPGYGSFCSHECRCAAIDRKVLVTCGYCGRRFRRQPAEVGKTANFCDRDCYWSWRKAGTDPKGYVRSNGSRVRDHRVVAEQMLGRPLRKGEVVHHIDRNPKNNDPSNLMVLTSSEHFKLHHREDGHPRWGKPET